VTLPPLRERPHDLLPLAEHLLRFFAAGRGQPHLTFSDAAKGALARHHWPGNLRELRNAVERAVILGRGPVLGPEDLPAFAPPPPAAPVGVGAAVTLEQLEVEHIRRVLAAAPTAEDAAARLGIDPSTLYRKRKRYGL
jgi:NtrC-family two-component system response regulator AlgB